jgi:hypothetical protein
MTTTAQDLQGMVSHWLGCRPNGYLGSDYGSGVADLLQTPTNGGAADDLITKLRTDIPLVGALPADTLGLYAQPDGPDRLRIYIEVAGGLVPVEDRGASA